MNAEEAGKLVAKFVEKQWPNDREDVWEILRLGINKAWQDGKWLGMTSEFYTPILKDRSNQSYIVAPQSHPILLAINGEFQGMKIRDKHFMFHRNGYGDIRDYPGCTWNADVYDIGGTPYLNKNNINFADGGIRIGVRAIGVAGENEYLYVNGTHTDGKQIYTYSSSSYGKCVGCAVESDSIDTIDGVKIPITADFNYVNNICFGEISSITKTITRTPIEVIAIDTDNNASPIAYLSPNQRFSRYRKYLVPNDLCGRDCLHGLFKIAQQEKITNPSDNIIISNDEALIALAKGIHNMYYKDQQEVGASYILQALSVLDKEKREEESPNEFPIQVEGMHEGDLPNSLKYNS